jgi:UDP-glucose 4-epimerase
VRVLDNFSTGNLGNLALARHQIELVNGDITDLKKVREASQGVELVFHHAALPSVPRSLNDPLSTHAVCATGTLNVLLAAYEARVRRVIYGASAAAYGDGSPAPRREDEALRPNSPYAAATLAGEYYCSAFAYNHGLETVRLRYFNVFGPRQPAGSPFAGVVPLFVEAMLSGQRPVIHGDGRQARDFTYVDDVVQANLLAIQPEQISGRVYNVGCGRATTLLDLVDRLNEILDTSIRPIHTLPRPGDIRHSQADLAKAQAHLGYCPCTDLEQSLRRCVDYHALSRRGPKRVGQPVCRVH